jgi:lambda family phage portal protein
MAVGLAAAIALAIEHYQAAPTTRPTAVATRPGPKASIYEAGSTGTRRTSSWRAPTVTPNAAVLAQLGTLRDRSRLAVRNDGYAGGAIDTIVTNLIGTGVTLRSKATNPDFQQQANALWNAWTRVSDADGQLDWYGQQTQAARAWLEGGECFVRLRPRFTSDGLPVPLQLQVLEPELCPYTYNVYTATTKIRAGIEFDRLGRRIAYHFYRSRPELDDFDASQTVRVPADQVIHLFDPLRPGQLRGVPHLTRALVRFLEIDKFNDATLLRQQIGNLFAGFVRRPATVGDAADLNPITNHPNETDTNGQPFATLQAGTIQELDPGDELEFADPPDAGSNYEPFMRSQLYGAARAAGLPYELLSGDLSRVNDRTVRVILHEFRRRMMAWQHQIIGVKFCQPVWQAFMTSAYVTGALPFGADYETSPLAYDAVKYAPHGWPYLHPVQDIEATQKAIRIGITSRQSAVAEQGEDVEDIDQEQADDNARADALELAYDSDGRRALSGGTASANASTLSDVAPATTQTGATAA